MHTKAPMLRRISTIQVAIGLRYGGFIVYVSSLSHSAAMSLAVTCMHLSQRVGWWCLVVDWIKVWSLLSPTLLKTGLSLGKKRYNNPIIDLIGSPSLCACLCSYSGHWALLIMANSWAYRHLAMPQDRSQNFKTTSPQSWWAGHVVKLNSTELQPWKMQT